MMKWDCITSDRIKLDTVLGSTIDFVEGIDPPGQNKPNRILVFSVFEKIQIK